MSHDLRKVYMKHPNLVRHSIIFIAWLASTAFILSFTSTILMGVPRFNGAQITTQKRLNRINRELIHLSNMLHKTPQLADLRTVLGNEYLNDGWGHPFIFVNDSGHVYLISYGRDNKQGGLGKDCDLTSDDPYSNNCGWTYRQFFTDRTTQPFILLAMMLGYAVVWGCDYGIKSRKWGNREIAGYIIQMIITIIFAYLIASVMIVMQVDGRHH